ncbi:unnamed protein product [Dovyalis caffra]|uniref:Uncharacterized protein n=1 Tax=Dovyalis caffra TaxID=77055 RepID=A0AAV1RYN9_9ROSI|nr:unnamed protein product [Dovyalis caffra]
MESFFQPSITRLLLASCLTSANASSIEDTGLCPSILPRTLSSSQVLEWMEEAGVQPSNGMYCDIFSFAQKSGATYASIIQERVGMQILLLLKRIMFWNT